MSWRRDAGSIGVENAANVLLEVDEIDPPAVSASGFGSGAPERLQLSA